LFEPPADALYTIEATSRIVDVPRRTIAIYCKYHLLATAQDTTDYGYYFDGDAIRTLRRIEALRAVCGDDFVGIKIILGLTAALERSRSDIRLLMRAKGLAGKSSRKAASTPYRRIDVRSGSQKRK
jgi:DNA-binding transcriptional MerR regulator